MIGSYGQPEEEDGWFDCQGASGWMPWSLAYCQIVKPVATSTVEIARGGADIVQSGADQATKLVKLVKTMVIVLFVLGLGAATFLGVNTLRKRKRKRKNPRKKQGIGSRIARILGGLVLAGVGAIGYVGPQAAEPISTLVGGSMGLGGLYLIGSGVVGPEQAKKIRKEIRG